MWKANLRSNVVILLRTISIKCFLLLCIVHTAWGQYDAPLSHKASFISKGLEWKGVAIRDENYSILGCAPGRHIYMDPVDGIFSEETEPYVMC